MQLSAKVIIIIIWFNTSIFKKTCLKWSGQLFKLLAGAIHFPLSRHQPQVRFIKKPLPLINTFVIKLQVTPIRFFLYLHIPFHQTSFHLTQTHICAFAVLQTTAKICLTPTILTTRLGHPVWAPLPTFCLCFSLLQQRFLY